MVEFKPQKLDADKNNDQFFEGARSGNQAVMGSRQWVYWRNCSIKVYNKGQEHLDPILRIEKSDGQGFLDNGLNLIVDGDQVKEV
ncbi:hypothetical protein FLAG1_10655 [Fusarium langsethiae]|uniref:Uncharacterized protein n=1 Tax=Fusarium langsethiae TaxID=179993 RepID=A0A0N0DBC6_FUSLA|nr:hypothetical protein FLAG1_10655 [Fusarium langsethiae]